MKFLSGEFGDRAVVAHVNGIPKTTANKVLVEEQKFLPDSYSKKCRTIRGQVQRVTDPLALPCPRNEYQNASRRYVPIPTYESPHENAK